MVYLHFEKGSFLENTCLKELLSYKEISSERSFSIQLSRTLLGVTFLEPPRRLSFPTPCPQSLRSSWEWGFSCQCLAREWHWVSFFLAGQTLKRTGSGCLEPEKDHDPLGEIKNGSPPVSEPSRNYRAGVGCPQRHIDDFGLKLLKKWPTQEEGSDLLSFSLKAGNKPSPVKVNFLHLGGKTPFLPAKDREFRLRCLFTHKPCCLFWVTTPSPNSVLILR